METTLDRLIATCGDQLQATIKELESRPQIRGIAEIPPPVAGDEVLKNRFLCKGGTLLLCGPTGIGKSSFMMQCVLSWAAGMGCFGINPVRPLRILIVQSENDDGDLWEHREGVVAGLEMAGEQLNRAMNNVMIWTERAAAGQLFLIKLEQAMAGRNVDMIVIDPAFGFLGGDASSQADVSNFLRQGLGQIIDRTGVCAAVIHHTNKPARGKEKEGWKAGDYAYLGAGSAEWANWARAVLGIRSVGSHEVFELIAAKRGSRLGWRDADDLKTVSRHIAHDGREGVICWRDARPDEVPGKENEEVLPVEQRIANLWKFKKERLPKKEFIDRAKAQKVSRPTAYRWWEIGVERCVFKLCKNCTDVGELTTTWQPTVPCTPEDEKDRGVSCPGFEDADSDG